MAIDKVKAYLKEFDVEDKVMEFETSSATVELAAQAVGVEPARIAKTLSFKSKSGDHAVLIVTAGDTKIDNSKFKGFYGMKAKMLSPEEVEEMAGHAVGGVCPFAVPETAEIYLDESLKRFDTVFPACGSSNSAIELTCAQLEKYAKAKEWVDVCKGWE
ncbi:YbaK/EbsC family protein [uncultured Robinsoniella sp.]|uniref:YbaK/EbsC family protein n=1 Tax=uncultured Robinsoniella sp. TaxID=904190 RepID=UPI00374E76FC